MGHKGDEDSSWTAPSAIPVSRSIVVADSSHDTSRSSGRDTTAIPYKEDQRASMQFTVTSLAR